jgi:two-component system KDP operon response regulator KdpE
MRKLRILVVDDDPRTHRLLAPALNKAGCTHVRAETLHQGLALVLRKPPDAVLLDLELPDSDSQEAVKKLRLLFRGPILVLSTRDRETEKIEALDAGADDYMEKPFHVADLLARLRINVQCKLRSAESPLIVRAGDLKIDLQRRLVTRLGAPVHLTPKEYELLAKLVQGNGRLLTHKELLVSLWGRAHSRDTQYLRVFVGQLRQKIEPNPSEPKLILTQPGIGYRFIADEIARPSGP